MSVKIAASDIIPSVYRFLAKYGFGKAANALKQACDVEAKGGISNIKLLKICKFYLKHHPDLVIEDDGEEEQPQEEQEEEEAPKTTKAKAKKSDLNTKRKPVKEDLEEEEEEEEEKPVVQKKKTKVETAPSKDQHVKTNKAAQKTKKVEEDEEEEEEEEEEDKGNKKQDQPVLKEKSAGNGLGILNSKNQDTFNGHQDEEPRNNKLKTQQQRFSYVDTSVIDAIPEHIRDNTFEAKDRFGVGDEFGRFGNERLKDTRGRGFKKEKTKLKNKQFHGGNGRIDPTVRNSIKLGDE